MSVFLKRVFSIVFSFISGFVTYPISYLPCLNDSKFEVPTGIFNEERVMLNGAEEKIILEEGVEFDDGAVKLDSTASFSFCPLILTSFISGGLCPHSIIIVLQTRDSAFCI